MLFRSINAQFAKKQKELDKHLNAYILNSDSSKLPLAEESVDLVVTDPPFFDFVHYSELSDFFYAWLQPVVKKEYFKNLTCRNKSEVQERDSDIFSKKIQLVFRECWRVLRKNGLLVFSFHHSKPEGWYAIYRAITLADFRIVSCHPVKAEMSVGSPKFACKNPINLDAILVCKKNNGKNTEVFSEDDIEKNVQDLFSRFANIGRKLSDMDKRVILSATVCRKCSVANLEHDLCLTELKRVFSKKSEYSRLLSDNKKAGATDRNH